MKRQYISIALLLSIALLPTVCMAMGGGSPAPRPSLFAALAQYFLPQDEHQELSQGTVILYTTDSSDSDFFRLGQKRVGFLIQNPSCKCPNYARIHDNRERVAPLIYTSSNNSYAIIYKAICFLPSDILSRNATTEERSRILLELEHKKVAIGCSLREQLVAALKKP